MLLEIHDRLGSPAKIPATRLVVRDNMGNPVLVAIQSDERNIFFSHKGQPGFEQALLNLGITDTSVVDVVKARELPRIQV